MLRRHGAAAAVAAAALAALVACETPPPPNPAEARMVMDNIEAGLDLYEAGDFVLAAQRFHEASRGAYNCGDLPVERRASTAECTSWLRAGRLAAFGACTKRLEGLHRRERRSDPGLNTLIALGAVSAGRPLPPFRVPGSVQAMVRAAAKE